ncbi:MAG: extracellular solute-binding protein [Chloroflexi bacterium]|nr:extracellular solute-binding protein [Chloroflexota bacterium]
MQKSKLSRRDFLRTSALASVGLALVACAPAATTAPAASGGAAAAPAADVTTIRWMSRASAEENPIIQKHMDEVFSAKNPNIKVSIEPAPEGFEQKLLAQMVAGTAVDIFEAWGNIFFNWTERDLLLDIQSMVDRDLKDEQVKDYNDFQWQGLQMQGKRIGMPKYINVMTVTVNKDLFEKYGVDLPPEDGKWTHDDYAVMAQKLTEGARKAGNENQWGGWKPAWSWDRFWNTVYMFGGGIVDQKYGTKCLMDTKESQAGFQWMYDRIWKDNTFAQPGEIEKKWGDDALAPGFVAFIEDGTYPIGRDKKLGDAKVNWDMRHVPTGPTGKRSVLGTTDAWSITKQTKHPEEAWKVLSYLAGTDFQDAITVGLQGLIPVQKSRIANFITTVRKVRPSLEKVRLETIDELLKWNYAEDGFWFKKQQAAFDLINPALSKVFEVGDVGPEYLAELTAKVNASQA